MVDEQVQTTYTAGQLASQKEMETLLRAIVESEDLLSMLEHEFRGEVMITTTDNDGVVYEKWINKNAPIINSEQGITELLRILRFMGLNKISTFTFLDATLINQKLKAFECKLSDLFFLKRKEWGIRKEDMPMIYHLIMSIVEDAFYRTNDGNLMRVLKSTYSHQEYKDNTVQQKSFLGKNQQQQQSGPFS